MSAVDSKPVIELDGVDFSYGGPSILRDINLRVKGGEFLGLVGPNAGGKSTLLKLILGLLSPQSGSVRVLGKSPAAVTQRIGYVSQYPSFPRDFPVTVEQVVQLGRLGMRPAGGWWNKLLPQRLSRSDREATLKALGEVEADTIAQRQIGSLSGGQLQRVLLARALAAEPEILILDEPTANIDQRLESEIFDLLRTLNTRMTILVVSHDIGFISHYVNRVACINRSLVCHCPECIDGQVIQELYGEHVHMISHDHGKWTESANNGSSPSLRTRDQGEQKRG